MKAEVRCPKCKKEWEYKGINKHYITCPDCRKLFDIEQNKVKKND